MKYQHILYIGVCYLLFGIASGGNQKTICNYWIGQSVNFNEPDSLQIAVKFSDACAVQTDNRRRWNFTVNHEPLIDDLHMRLECDCITRNCSKTFVNVNFVNNKVYRFTFYPKCFMTACSQCTPVMIRLTRRNTRLTTTHKPATNPMQSSPAEQRTYDRTTLPIFIGCLCCVALVSTVVALIYLHRVYKINWRPPNGVCPRVQHQRYAIVQTHPPDNDTRKQVTTLMSKTPQNTNKSNVLVLSNSSTNCTKFLNILSLFSDHFQATHVLQCAYELTLNFYDWVESILDTYGSLVIVLDEDICGENQPKMDTFRMRDILQSLKSSLRPDRIHGIRKYIVTFGHQEELVMKAVSSYPYLHTGAVFGIPDDDLQNISDISDDSPFVELLVYLCGNAFESIEQAREYIRRTLRSSSSIQT